MELYEYTAHELAGLLREKRASAKEITQSVFQRIRAVEGLVDAYISLSEESALEQAAAVDEKIAIGEPLAPLAGIPVAVKDNICIQGGATTCASRMLENFRPPYHAAVTEKLLENDMVVTGKCNMDEFAMGSSCENSAFKPTKNPHDLTRIPGGSSGGSAAALAAMECAVSIGSDTGGSIRQPASCCGVFGLKPTYGAVSRYGLVAYASSLDQIGPFGRSALDIAMLCNVLYGHDGRDSTSLNRTYPDFTEGLGADMKGRRIGLPKEYFSGDIPDSVLSAVRGAALEFEKMGAVVEEMSLPLLEYAIPTDYILASAEASSNLARYDGIKYGYRAADFDNLSDLYLRSRTEGFGGEVKRRILLGNYVLSSGYYDAYYKKALAAQRLMRSNFRAAFEKYDMLITPTMPVETFKLGERVDDPRMMYMVDLCTVSINIAGVPAVSVPCGRDGNGMPVGMQIIGNHLSDKLLVSGAYAYERHTDMKIGVPAAVRGGERA